MMVTKEEFSALCTKLDIATRVEADTWSAWTQLGHANSKPDISNSPMKWLACLLYTTSVEARYPYGLNDPIMRNGCSEVPRFNLFKLLSETGMSMAELCSQLQMLKNQSVVGDTARDSITLLLKRYLICAPIFDKFERIFKEIFLQEQPDIQSENLHSNEEEKPTYKRKLIWSLFVLAKEIILAKNAQLISSFQVLLCALDHVIFFTPSFLLNSPYDEVHRESCSEGQSSGVMRKFLCQKYGASLEDSQALYNSWAVNVIQPHGVKVQELAYVEKQYVSLTQSKTDFNELLFLDGNGTLFPEVKGQANHIGVMGDQVTATPIKSAMRTLHQLKAILESAMQDGPSSKLRSYFQKCPTSPLQCIQDRLAHLKDSFLTSMQQVMGQGFVSVAENRFRMAVALHYQVMEALLISEEQRLSIQDFSDLLNRDTFHMSLLACAVEVVLTTYKTAGNSSPTLPFTPDSADPTAFPWILTVFNLKPYNFFKVLESFVKAEPRLSWEIVRHLQNVEKIILEHLSWEYDSPVYDAMKVSEIKSVPVPLNGDIKEVSNTTAPCDLFKSPVPQRSSSHTNGSDPAPSGGQVKKSDSLNLFLNKVARLGYNRLLALCNKLELPKDLIHKIWTCFEYCFSHRPDLMRNRHLDQIMLCSIYGICKVVEHEVTFKEIVSYYKQQFPNVPSDVYKDVLVDGDRYGTIIMFYNDVFMNRTKSFILQFSPTRQNKAKPVLSPAPKSVPSPLTNSPVYTLPGRKNFFVSPMKESPFKAPPPASPSHMTPRTRQLYSFGDTIGSGEKFQQINEAMRAVKRKQPGFATSNRQKKLTFETFEEHSCPDQLTINTDHVRDVVTRKTVELVAAFGHSDENAK